MAKTVKKEASEVPEATKFSLEALRASCTELFNCSSATFDGATYGFKVTDRFSTVEVTEMIKKYKTQKI